MPDCNFDLYIVGADGSGLSQLTSGPEADFGGDVSPDGHRVVFSWAVHGQTRWQLVQLWIDGGHQRVLVESSQRMNFPRWSPSGNQIVFARQFGSKTHLFLLDVSTERVDSWKPATIRGIPSVIWSHRGLQTDAP